MDVKWLHDFLVLAEVRHFSRAAALRHITQPAFGRHIQALEQAVGRPLIDRTTTPLGLTEAGRQFHALARSLVAQLDEGLETIRDEGAAPLPPLRIASPHALASPLLLDMLDALAGAFAVAVEVMRMDEAERALADGRCDLMLGFDSLALMKPPYRHLLLGEGRFVLASAVRPDGGPLFDPTRNLTPYLRYSSDAYSARLLQRHNHDAGLWLKPVFESSMCQLLAEMALRGKGVAWLPDTLIASALADGRLLALSPMHLQVAYQVRLYRQRTRLSPAAEALWRELALRRESGWRLTPCQLPNTACK